MTWLLRTDQINIMSRNRWWNVCILKHWKVSDEGTLVRYLGVHFTKDAHGGWTVDISPYITQAKKKCDQWPLPISPTIPIPTDWNVVSSDWDGYTLDIKLLKHYQSIIGVLIWTEFQYWDLLWVTISPYCRNTWQDQQRNLSKLNKSGIQGYGIPSGSLQDLLQHTDIPWIANQNICCMWCQFWRWPTYREKSSRTLDFLPADLLNGKSTGNER